MWHEARLLGAGIVGGDLVSAPQWVISVTVLGDLGGRAPVRRGGARPGDTVAVIGDLGRSAAGYALWHNGDSRSSRSCAGGIWCPSRRTVRARRPPMPVPPSMTDVSDGLLADLGHIAPRLGRRHRRVARRAGRRPRCARRRRPRRVGADAWDWVLGGGEDHALVATFPGAPPAGWRVIGRVLDGAAAGCWWTAPRWARKRGLAVVLTGRAHARLTFRDRTSAERTRRRRLGPRTRTRRRRRSPQMGEFLRAETGRGPPVSAGRTERVARLHVSRSTRSGCSSSGRIRIRRRATRSA